jgi:hypothetical protein
MPFPNNYMDSPPKNVPLRRQVGTYLGVLAGAIGLFLLMLWMTDKPFGVQIVAIVADSASIFLFVFCDTRALHGYSLRDRRVRDQMPAVVGIHLIFLTVIAIGFTFAWSLRPLLPVSFVTVPGRRSQLESNLAILLLFLGCGVAIVESFLLRRTLARALHIDASTPLEQLPLI